MTAPWLAIVGIGEDGVAGLPQTARTLLEDAKVIYGGQRHLAMLGKLNAKKRPWPSPLSAAMDKLEHLRGTPTVVLATGNPMWFGIGATLAKRFSVEELTVLPAPSAFQLAAARLGWPMADVETLTLHGRPADRLRAALFPGAKILALTVAETPRLAADILIEEGYGASRMVVLEHMGGPKERRVEATASDWNETVAEFHTLAIECVADADVRLRARVPGLPDDVFQHDGKMTKSEVRAVTLAHLMPVPGALLWDIGAGCGSVAIEWMRAARSAKAIAIEPLAERRAFVAANASALGVPTLDIREGTAPEALADLPEPDAIFIGGGLTSDGTFEAAWAALKPGGRLVANAVTLESEAVLLKLYAEHGGELIRLAVSRASSIGELTGWRPMMPVTQLSLIKGGSAT